MGETRGTRLKMEQLLSFVDSLFVVSGICEEYEGVYTAAFTK